MRDELLLTFNLYCRTPFGRLHRNNPEIVALAQKLNRTASAVAMKSVNFASFDPSHQSRNVRGLSNASRADRAIWDEFNANSELLAYESQQAYRRILADFSSDSATGQWDETFSRSRPTESTRLVRVRLVQSFFRNAVLASYEYRCAICRLDLLELLSASHIIPWKINIERRADPRNGLALCAIHDRAFDRGLLTITEFLTVRSSKRVKTKTPGELHAVALVKIDGQAIMLPKRFHPAPEALAYHREHVFKD
ncbi:MAG: HNH endonuclease [Acidobacteriota bacterium]|nr:HNH endonuclease [Acidobacteriota bacterium]